MEEIAMSTLNGFSVSVPEAQEETSDGYVILKHDQHFRIRLHNSHKDNGIGKAADCEIYLSGKYIGTYRIPYGQTILLEHPINDFGKFTAYRNGTPEAEQAEIDSNDPDNGLIKVIWKPGTKKCHYEVIDPYIGTGNHYPRTWIDAIETYPITRYDTTSAAIPLYYNTTTDGGHHFFNGSTSCCVKSHATRSCNDLTGGGIGLSDHSNQKFTETEPLDYNECDTTIYLRIAFRNNEHVPRPLKPVYKTSVPRPLM